MTEQEKLTEEQELDRNGLTLYKPKSTIRRFGEVAIYIGAMNIGFFGVGMARFGLVQYRNWEKRKMGPKPDPKSFEEISKVL
jgi:hypothetical protein